jgi:hypothetical protein
VLVSAVLKVVGEGVEEFACGVRFDAKWKRVVVEPAMTGRSWAWRASRSSLRGRTGSRLRACRGASFVEGEFELGLEDRDRSGQGSEAAIQIASSPLPTTSAIAPFEPSPCRSRPAIFTSSSTTRTRTAAQQKDEHGMKHRFASVHERPLRSVDVALFGFDGATSSAVLLFAVVLGLLGPIRSLRHSA